MGFTIPNYTDAVTNKEVGDQAEPDSVDFQILGNPSNGVVYDPTNFANNARVRSEETISNSVRIDPYKVLINGVYYVNTSASITLPLGEGSANPRFDLVVIRASSATESAPAVITGTTSAANPEFPAITDNDVVIAAVYRSGVGVSGYVDSSHIVDKRLFLNSNQTWVKSSSPLVNTADAATAKIGDLWLDTSATATGQTMLWVKQASGSWKNISSYIEATTNATANTLVLRDGSGAFTASAVAWDNVTGKPTDIVTNNGATYGINISGSSGYAGSSGYGGYLYVSPGVQFGWNGITGQWGTINGLYSAGLLSSAGGLNVSGDTTLASNLYYTISQGNTSSSTKALVVNTNGRVAFNTLSSLRSHKENINDMEGGLDLVNQLRPRTFIFNQEHTSMDNPYEVFCRREQLQYGFVVEEVQEVNPDFIQHEETTNGHKPQMWKQEAMIAALVSAVQELSAKVEALEAKTN